MIARVAAMPADLSAGDNERLAALLDDTARLAGAEEASAWADELRELTRLGLEALRARWSAAGEALDNGALRSFYRASATLQPPIAGPDLRPTWSERVEMVTDYAWEKFATELQVAEEWVELAELLASYEPMWLIGFDFPDGYRGVAEEVLDLIERQDDSLGAPEVQSEDDPTEFAEPPPDLEWMVAAERIVGRIEELDPELGERCATLPGQMDSKASRWRDYSDHHESIIKRSRGEDGDYEERGNIAEEFDVSAFFVDL
jgi:hypothetical protein